jgi:hypothetical protein
MDERVTLRKLERVMRDELNADEREALLKGKLTQELRALHVVISQDERRRGLGRPLVTEVSPLDGDDEQFMREAGISG